MNALQTREKDCLDESRSDVRLNRLERQIKSMRLAILGLILILIAALTMALKTDATGQILRIQGLIIEGEGGQPRILIGTTFPLDLTRSRIYRELK